jgi:hypothetical protein
VSLPFHEPQMSSDSLLGRELDEYRILSLLGRGGMARVYLGLDTRLQRYVALKVIDAPYRQDPEYLRRFDREAMAIAQLDHPHIVRLYRYGDSDDLIYMAMQYIEGADLHTVAASFREDGEFMPLEEVSRIVGEICQALDYAHAQGVIHRDVKPSNVILNKEGKAILTDFGLVLFEDSGSRGEVFGTPHFMAPEQAVSSASAVPASDLYSVGVILYELLTGVLPFEAEDPLDIALMHVNDPPPPPRQFRPELKPETEAVILRALAKEPAARYPSGEALAQAFDRASQAIVGPPETQPLHSVSDRVTQHFLAKPLPPMPAAVALPPEPVDDLTAEPDAAFVEPAPGAGFGLDGRWLLVVGGCLGLSLIAFLALVASMLVWQGRTDALATMTATTFLPFILGSEEAMTATPTSPEARYELLFARRGDDSMFIVNSGDITLPLEPLQVGSGRGAISGEEWGLDSLAVGDCVTVWKSTGRPRAPDVSCTQVGETLMRPGRERFWTDPFPVYYHGEEVGRCSRGDASCAIAIQAP